MAEAFGIDVVSEKIGVKINHMEKKILYLQLWEYVRAIILSKECYMLHNDEAQTRQHECFKIALCDSTCIKESTSFGYYIHEKRDSVGIIVHKKQHTM